MTDREKVIKGLQIERECVARECDRNCAVCDLVQDRDWLLSVYDDALALLKEQEEAEEEVNGTLDKLIKETQNLLSKAPTDFDKVKGIIERSSLRKHFDEATIETGERIITLRHGADEVDLLFDKDGRIE